MPKKPRVPSYRLHKPSGRAVVTIAGRDVYLGAYGSPESREAYHRAVAESLAGTPAPPAAPAGYTVAEVAAAYQAHAAAWYVKDGRQTTEVKRIAQALDKLTALYGGLPAAQFGPKALKAVRGAMVEAGWTRGYCNSCTGCVKRAFRWAVGEELLPGGVWEALRAVPGLVRGRCAARETERVKPVPDADVEPALARCLPVVADMARLQLLTGMRPGEVCQMRPGDLDRSGPVWAYRPGSHKTEHHGSERVVYLGPRAQAVLAPYLLRGPEVWCFSPREAMERDRERKGQRPRFGRGRCPRDAYTTMTYGRAIRDACRKAGVTPWHPHRLRHNAATLLRREYGPDVARAVLGQRSLDATEVYAELSLDKAAEAMGKVG